MEPNKRSPYSILSKVTRDDVIMEPFPHIVIKNALDDEIYEDMSRNFPLLNHKRKEGDDEKVEMEQMAEYGMNLIGQNLVNETWQKFINYQLSDAFFKDFVDVFGPAIQQAFPNQEEYFGKRLEELSAGPRPSSSRDALNSRGNVMGNKMELGHVPDTGFDCALDMATVVTYTRPEIPVRGPHLDRPNKLFAMLFYFKDPRDTSEGGDLVLHKVKDDRAYRKKDVVYTSNSRSFDEETTEEINRATYGPNTLALFINTRKAIHSATIRPNVKYPRRHVYMHGDLAPRSLYQCVDTPPTIGNKLRSVYHRVRNLV